MSSYYANIVKSTGQRDPVDRYETPYSITEGALKRIDFPENMREPACGTGRIRDVLILEGHRVFATDLLEDGIDFISSKEPKFEGGLMTNPPYKGGLAEAFARKALEIVTGPVALLVRIGFPTSQKRCKLFTEYPPSNIFFVSERIHFYKADGSRISGQAHDHCWVVWRNPKDIPMIDWIGPDETYDARD